MLDRPSDELPRVIRSSEPPFVHRLSQEDVDRARAAEFRPLPEMSQPTRTAKQEPEPEPETVVPGVGRLASLAERFDDVVDAEIAPDDVSAELAPRPPAEISPQPRKQVLPPPVARGPVAVPPRVRGAYHPGERSTGTKVNEYL